MMAETKPTLLYKEAALEIVLRVIQQLPPVTMPLHDALRKVLAEDIPASDPLPPFPASFKAVVASDELGEYPVIAEARAGSDGIGVTLTPGLWHMLLLEGCHIEKDDVVLLSGQRICAVKIGILATVGGTMVKVYRTPKIGVLSTGDELVEPTTGCLSRGQVIQR